MSPTLLHPKLSICTLCRVPFDTSTRYPCTQSCQHSICLQCIQQENTSAIHCPIDHKLLNITGSINYPLVEYLSANSTSISSQPYLQNNQFSIDYYLIELALLLKSTSSNNLLSPQLTKRLVHLIHSTFYHVEGRSEFVRRLSSVFNRLLLELVQAQYNTKQREKYLIRLVTSKGCTILHPNLTDKVIDNLVRLYAAAGNKPSFERSVLIKYLLKEIGDQGKDKRQVELIVQTLYRASCFHVIKPKNEKVPRLKLKEDLCNINDLRQQHDVDLIKLAQTEHIRLPPESWARLLYSCPHPDIVSKMQSLLDKYQSPITVTELKLSLEDSDDPYGLGVHLDRLQKVENLLCNMINKPENLEPRKACEILENLVQMKHLFALRQQRTCCQVLHRQHN